MPAVTNSSNTTITSTLVGNAPDGVKLNSIGTFTANGATAVTVADANITANSQVMVTLKTVGGTVGASAPTCKTITVGVGFTIAGLASDTSIYNYAILNPTA